MQQRLVSTDALTVAKTVAIRVSLLVTLAAAIAGPYTVRTAEVTFVAPSVAIAVGRG